MVNSRQPLFLARASYRKRRLRDGARILPLFGLMLCLLPLMWPAIPHKVGGHWLFLFLLWLGLIAVAAILSRGLREPDTATGRETSGSESSERAFAALNSAAPNSAALKSAERGALEPDADPPPIPPAAPRSKA